VQLVQALRELRLVEEVVQDRSTEGEALQPLGPEEAGLRAREDGRTWEVEGAQVGEIPDVVEEVVVSKTADERVEQIDETVRKTEVEIDRDSDVDVGRGSAFGTSTDR